MRTRKTVIALVVLAALIAVGALPAMAAPEGYTFYIYDDALTADIRLPDNSWAEEDLDRSDSGALIQLDGPVDLSSPMDLWVFNMETLDMVDASFRVAEPCPDCDGGWVHYPYNAGWIYDLEPGTYLLWPQVTPQNRNSVEIATDDDPDTLQVGLMDPRWFASVNWINVFGRAENGVTLTLPGDTAFLSYPVPTMVLDENLTWVGGSFLPARPCPDCDGGWVHNPFTNRWGRAPVTDVWYVFELDMP